jgi:hypothetical protein
LPRQPSVISIINTAIEELEELPSATEESDEAELDGIGLPPVSTELEIDEALLNTTLLLVALVELVVAAELLIALLEDVIALELEVLPPPPLLPPQAVSTRLTANIGITFCTRIGKLRYCYEML